MFRVFKLDRGIMVITNDNVKLRDMIESDIDDYVLWFTKELDWQDTDAPWEKEELNTAIEERESWSEYFEYTKTILDDELRWKFEI
ncbi:MAG: hypothetical protein K6B64_01950, partial [Acholeplasmatales bacterium]|nr:hypothetical protein [Acholeplasmatales bacterium]